MHLKSLSLRGFKSFAQPTTLALEPGIICVVGPNGSGKSNIVDALAWVMGEQGAKTLRGSNMADVIFAGTATRPALGRAEVRLTIDNSSADLPIDYSEMTISRTLFRQGGSEYAINGTPVRLLDIQELLSDTGMGRSMHVIVGQGQLDEVLRADATERRAFIEEAAGVLKHRRRKERALRKLERIADKIDRLEDLTREIGRQLGPLAKQARIASQAQIIQALERDLRARLLADDTVTQRDAWDSHQRSSESLNAKRAEAAQLIAQAEAELSDIEETAVLDEPAQRASEQWRQLTGLHEALASLQTIAGERARQLSEPVAQPGGPDLDERERRLERLRGEAADSEEAYAEAERALAAARADDEATSAAERDAEAALAQARQAAEAAMRHHRRLEGEATSTRSRAEAAVDARDRALTERDEALARARDAKEALARQPEAADADAAHGQDAYDEAQERSRACVLELEAAQADLERATRDEATWVSRRDALALSLRPEEATGALLGAKLEGIVGPLAPTLDVEPGWEDALGHALGEIVGSAIATTPEHAVAALDHVRELECGRVCLVVASPEASCATPGSLTPATRWASQVVRSAEPGVSEALAVFLEGVALAHSLADARAACAAGARLVVTDDGEWVRPVAFAGGTSSSETLLSLQAECDRASEEADAAAARRAVASSRVASAREAARTAEAECATALAQLRSADAHRAELAQARARASAEATSAVAQVERAERALAQASEQVEARWREAERAREELEDFEQRLGDGDYSDLEERAGAAREAQRRSREAYAEARLALAAREQRRRQAGAAVSAAEADRDGYARRMRQATAETQRRARLGRIARAVEDQARRAGEIAARGRDEAQRQMREAEEARRASSAKAREVRQAIDAQRRTLTDLTQALHADEVAAAQVSLRLDQLAETAQEELALDLDTLVAQFGPHNLVPDPDDPDAAGRPFVRAEVERRACRAQRDLKALGTVNPLALEEHRALEERYRFMNDQLGDVKASRADLLRLIAEVDDQVETAFAAAYEDTSRAFQDVFDTLFPGGKGRMILTDPDDMLTTGIDLEVRPAGKKVKRLSLLSGGERSLAALAFLFAIFKARPSPFYILDEVEAALDDANLTRMLGVFAQLREVSQLIVITHQKRTMEVADALYGVTMKDGVTTVISQRLAGQGTNG